MAKKKTRKQPTKMYTVGEINKIVDSALHPLYEKTEVFRLLDGLAHGVLEQNPSVSLRKFIRFNLPEILEKVMEEL